MISLYFRLRDAGERMLAVGRELAGFCRESLNKEENLRENGFLHSPFDSEIAGDYYLSSPYFNRGFISPGVHA